MDDSHHDRSVPAPERPAHDRSDSDAAPAPKQKAKAPSGAAKRKRAREAAALRAPDLALRVLDGATPRGAPGVPPNALRAALRTSYADRMAFLALVIDGAVVERARFLVRDVLPYAACPNCGEAGLTPREGHDDATIEVVRSASVRDRLAALEHQAKYGLGTLKDVSAESVRERVAATIALVRAQCDETTALRILAAMRPIWTA